MPILRQLRDLARLRRRDGALATDGKVDPAAAGGTASGEAGIAPPGAHQRIVNSSAMGLQAEVDGVQPLFTPWVRAGWIGVDDVGCHLALLATFAVKRVHLLQ